MCTKRLVFSLTLFLLLCCIGFVSAGDRRKKSATANVQSEEHHRRCAACKAIQKSIQDDVVAKLKDKQYSNNRKRRAVFMTIEDTCVNLNGFVSVGTGKEQRYMKLSDAVGSGGSMAGLNMKVDDDLKAVCAKVGKQWRQFIVNELANAKKPAEADLNPICDEVCDWVDEEA